MTVGRAQAKAGKVHAKAARVDHIPAYVTSLHSTADTMTPVYDIGMGAASTMCPHSLDHACKRVTMANYQIGLNLVVLEC